MLKSKYVEYILIWWPINFNNMVVGLFKLLKFLLKEY